MEIKKKDDIRVAIRYACNKILRVHGVIVSENDTEVAIRYACNKILRC